MKRIAQVNLYGKNSSGSIREAIIFCATVISRNLQKSESELGQNRYRDKQDFLKITEKCGTVVSISQSDPPF